MSPRSDASGNTSRGRSASALERSPRFRAAATSIALDMASAVDEATGIGMVRACRLLDWSSAAHKHGPEWLRLGFDCGLIPEYWALVGDLDSSVLEAWFRRGGRAPRLFYKAIMNDGDGNLAEMSRLMTEAAMANNRYAPADNGNVSLEASQWLPGDPLAPEFLGTFNQVNALLMGSVVIKRQRRLEIEHVLGEYVKLSYEKPSDDGLPGGIAEVAASMDEILTKFRAHTTRASGMAPVAVGAPFELPNHGLTRMSADGKLECAAGHAHALACELHLRAVLAGDTPFKIVTDDHAALIEYVDSLLLSRIDVHEDEYTYVRGLLDVTLTEWRRHPQAWGWADLLSDYADVAVPAGFIPKYLAWGLSAPVVDNWIRQGLLEPAQIYAANKMIGADTSVPEREVAQMASAFSREEIHVMDELIFPSKTLTVEMMRDVQLGWAPVALMDTIAATSFRSNGIEFNGRFPDPETLIETVAPCRLLQWNDRLESQIRRVIAGHQPNVPAVEDVEVTSDELDDVGVSL